MRAALVGLALAITTPAQQSWYLAHIPDVQWYTTDPGWLLHYRNMTGQMVWWQPPPVYVAQVGDFTQTAAAIEYERSVAAMRLLDRGGIPWGASIGNHDYEAPSSAIPCDGSCVALWTQHLGPTNYYRIVPTPEGPLLFLHLEWQTRNHWIEAARGWLDSNPGTPTILVTHHFTDRPHGTPAGGNYATGRIGTATTGVPGANPPDWIWRKLIEPYPQIFAVLSGHGYHMVRHVEKTGLGREVQLHCFNLQSDPYGGNGFVRLMQFEGRQLRLWTLSTSYTGRGPNRTDVVRLQMQRSVAEIAAEPQPLRLQAVADTFVFPFWGGNSTRPSHQLVRCSRGGEHVLLRFDLQGIASVKRALLTIHSDGYQTTGDGCSFHRMLRSWSEGDSWNSLGGLVAGRDYDPVPIAVLPRNARGPHALDFTTALRQEVGALRRGQPSHGWVAVATGNRATGWRSREWPELCERPLLIVLP